MTYDYLRRRLQPFNSRILREKNRPIVDLLLSLTTPFGEQRSFSPSAIARHNPRRMRFSNDTLIAALRRPSKPG
jgi:hypothetical protein